MINTLNKLIINFQGNNESGEGQTAGDLLEEALADGLITPEEAWAALEEILTEE